MSLFRTKEQQKDLQLYEESVRETNLRLQKVIENLIDVGVDWSGRIPLSNKCNGSGIGTSRGVYKVMDSYGHVVYYGEGKITQRIVVCCRVFLNKGEMIGGNQYPAAKKMYQENPDISNWFFSYFIVDKQIGKGLEKFLIDQDSPRFNLRTQAGAKV